MKNLFIFLLISVNIFAQKTVTVPFRQNLKDKSKMAKSLTVHDIREDKNIGSIVYRKENYDIKLPDDDLTNILEKSFDEDNKTKGNTEFLVVVKKIKVGQIPKGKSHLSKIEFDIASFIKKEDKYYFIDRTKKTAFVKPGPNEDIPKLVASKIGSKLSDFITDSFSHPVSKYNITNDQLPNYETAVVAQTKIFSNEKLVDGVYKDFIHFINQEPQKNYYVKKNKKGQITGVGDVDGYDVFKSKVYAFVDEGKPYLLTPLNFWEMQKDGNGYYLFASREAIDPEYKNNGAFVGMVAGGIVGGIVGGLIDASISKNKVNDQNNFYNIYIDCLTGELLYEK